MSPTVEFWFIMYLPVHKVSSTEQTSKMISVCSKENKTKKKMAVNTDKELIVRTRGGGGTAFSFI